MKNEDHDAIDIEVSDGANLERLEEGVKAHRYAIGKAWGCDCTYRYK